MPEHDLPIAIDMTRLREICDRYQVTELSIFGSVLRDDFGPDSDIDFLVEFEPGAVVGLIRFAGLQRELSELTGRPVDLVSKRALNHLIRSEVLSTAVRLHAA